MRTLFGFFMLGLFGRPLLQVRGLIPLHIFNLNRGGNGIHKISRISRFITSQQQQLVGRGGMFMKTRRGGGGGSGVPIYVPKTENQKKFVEALNQTENKLIVVLGPAGTGKTLFSCLRAIQELKSGAVKKIVITRPVITVEEELGFLPGNIRHKMDPWMQPIFDVFQEFYSKHDIESMIHSGVIEISPLAFMRGRTFKGCFILADEMQNSSPSQMLMLLTRIGDGSRMVVGGDLNQSDRDRDRDRFGGSNGLAEFVLRYRRRVMEGADDSEIKICQMGNGDVERSPIVSKILRLYSGEAGEKVEAEEAEEGDSAIIPKKDFFSKNRPLW